MAGILSSGNTDKYYKIRPEIKNGDLILYRGESLIDKGIQFFDKAYYNHIGIVWEPEDIQRVLTIDMWSDGIECIPLSRRIKGYKDFCILRPRVSSDIIRDSISTIIEDLDGGDIKYDNSLILRIAVIKKLRIDLTGLGKKDRYICSELAQYYCDLLGINTYSRINLISPEDFRRFIDDNFQLIFDFAPCPDMSYYEKDREIRCIFGKNYKLKI